MSEELAILKAGPEDDAYNEAWEKVVEDAELNNGNSARNYKLYESDGDVWAVPVHEWEEIG